MLAVRGLAKRWGANVALAGLDFDLAAGEVLALIGPNGAGKSTCFNLLNGQVPADAGSARLAGAELIGRKPRQVWRLGVGRTFQITATFGSMSVAENVQMALLSHHRRLLALWPPAASLYREPALALLDQVGMADQAGRACAVLAYGDLKRVELAMALANQPKLLLMDEPTAGMAPGERRALMALAAGIAAERGIGVLFTEHDMDVVFAHAHRILVLHRGQRVACGGPAEVRADVRVRDIYLGGTP